MVTGPFFECFQLHRTWRGFALPDTFLNLSSTKWICVPSLCQYTAFPYLRRYTLSNTEPYQIQIHIKPTLFPGNYQPHLSRTKKNVPKSQLQAWTFCAPHFCCNLFSLFIRYLLWTHQRHIWWLSCFLAAGKEEEWCKPHRAQLEQPAPESAPRLVLISVIFIQYLRKNEIKC